MTWKPVILTLIGAFALISAGLVVMNFSRMRSESASNACINNLRQIDAAVTQSELELQHVIWVSDGSNSPVDGASIAVFTNSVEAYTNETLLWGKASIPIYNGLQMIEVSKAGYVTQRVSTTTNWPIQVILKKLGK